MASTMRNIPSRKGKNRMQPTKIDLPETARVQLVELLNARLADCIDLMMQAKQAHWNVRGPHFFALHELFDKVHEETDEYVDVIAERAAQLGGTVEGTIRMAAKRSTIEEYPAQIVEGRAHVDALSTAIARFAKTSRQSTEKSNQLDDADTADVFTQVSRGIDKLLWLVESHLQGKM